jgi:hypothetical protein
MSSTLPSTTTRRTEDDEAFLQKLLRCLDNHGEQIMRSLSVHYQAAFPKPSTTERKRRADYVVDDYPTNEDLVSFFETTLPSILRSYISHQSKPCTYPNLQKLRWRTATL